MRRPSFPLALAAFVLAACGGDASFRADPDAVFRHTMRAVHAGDWVVLEALVTPRAHASLSRVLDGLRVRLEQGGEGGLEHRLARERLGADAGKALAAARQGGEGALLRFVARVSGLVERPAVTRRDLGPTQIEYLYADGRGVRRAVRLVRIEGRWTVDALQL